MSIPSDFAPEVLAAELDHVQLSRDATSIQMANPAGLIPEWFRTSPACHIVAAEVTEVRGGTVTAAMLNVLRPGAQVPVHTDQGDTERWHLPLRTNPAARWWDEDNGEVHFALGAWWGPLPYTAAHKVWNDGDAPRLHLVVDIQGV